MPTGLPLASAAPRVNGTKRLRMRIIEYRRLATSPAQALLISAISKSQAITYNEAINNCLQNTAIVRRELSEGTVKKEDKTRSCRALNVSNNALRMG
jgi:hypothetical protein